MIQFVTLPVHSPEAGEDKEVHVSTANIVRLAPEQGGTRVSMSNGWHVHTSLSIAEVAQLAQISIQG